MSNYLNLVLFISVAPLIFFTSIIALGALVFCIKRIIKRRKSKYVDITK